jgi:cobalt-zinc-cadmium resistance protein CzcA
LGFRSLRSQPASVPIRKKPFAFVIVAGLVSRLFLGFFVNPVLYQMVARDGDVLKV